MRVPPLYGLVHICLAVDKLRITVFIPGATDVSNIEFFFASLNKFEFIFHKEINSIHQSRNLLILISQKKNVNKVLKQLKMLRNNNLFKTSFLIPRKNNIKPIKYKFFTYPININRFEEQLYQYYSAEYYVYKSLSLINEDTLLCNIKKSKVKLTEIEYHIIKFLFIHKEVSKKTLNTEVLSQKKELESKSIETHLSRLRNKVLKLDKTIQIVSSKEKGVQII